jgi:hypothetical protein
LLKIPKKVFFQGEIVSVKINTSDNKVPLVKSTLKLIGVEKVEFSVMSLVGKTGFKPTFSFLLPSRHIRESTELFCQTHTIESIKNGYCEETISFEIPENAIPSYYGKNGKVVYEIELELELEDGSHEIENQQILVDSKYQFSLETEEINVNKGKIIIEYQKPFLIGVENQFKILTENLTKISPIRFIIKGIETVKASSGMVVENEMCNIPLGQIQYDEDLRDVIFKFKIPSDQQHSFEGLNSRLEYYFEIHHVRPKTRLGVDYSKLIHLSRFPIRLEYPIDRYQ